MKFFVYISIKSFFFKIAILLEVNKAKSQFYLPHKKGRMSLFFNSNSAKGLLHLKQRNTSVLQMISAYDYLRNRGNKKICQIQCRGMGSKKKRGKEKKAKRLSQESHISALPYDRPNANIKKKKMSKTEKILKVYIYLSTYL